MVNQVSGGIMGSCHRGLERIKRKLAFNGNGSYSQAVEAAFVAPGSAFGGEFPAAVALSGLALPHYPLDVTSMGQEAVGGQVEGDEWSEMPPLANLTGQLPLAVQSHCRTYRLAGLPFQTENICSF